MAKLNIRDRNKGKVDKNGKAKKPNWEYRFEAARINGVRKHISKAGFDTKAAALEAGTAALAEYNRSGQVFEPAETSVADFLDYWLKNFCEVNLSDNTTHGYEAVIRLHLKPKLGHYKLKSVTTLVLQELINDIYIYQNFSKGYSDKIFNVIRGAFTYAKKTAKLIHENPAEDLKRPNVDVAESENEDEIIILTNEEVSDILSRFKSSPFQYYAMLISYYSGLRVGEVYGLTWDDIDFEKKTITVNKSVKKFDYNSRKDKNYRGIKGKAKTKWYLGACKTPSSYRTVPIGDTLLNALLDYKEWQEENRRLYGELYTRTYLKDELTPNNRKVKLIVQMDSVAGVEVPLQEVQMVCVKENGMFTGTDSVKYPSKVINYDMAIRFTFHAFRHTHATKLIESGIPVKAVSERLGHSSTATTWNYYVKVTSEMENEAMQAFEEAGTLNLRNEHLYKKWKDLRNKLNNVSYYKERGIKLCDEWQNFKSFEKWSLENGFEEELHLIRKDKEKDYTPDNCMWSKENKSVKGKYIYEDGENIKSYSVQQVGRGWCYRITDYDGNGVRKDIRKAGFSTENEACIAAEGRISELFEEKNAGEEKPHLRLVK